MKKLIATALLLLSVATPCTTYSAKKTQNVQKKTTNPKAKKANNVKTPTLKRRFCATILEGVFYQLVVTGSMLLWIKIHSSKLTFDEILEEKGELQMKLVFTWTYHVIAYITAFFLQLFCRYILNMKVVDTNGQDASWKQLVIRYIVKWLPVTFLLPFMSNIDNKKALKAINIIAVILGVIQGIYVILEDKHRGLPDKIANTTIVKVKKSAKNA